MHESNELALRSILESIEKIERFSLNIRSWQDLKNDEKTFDACLMNFVIIGESVLRLDRSFVEANSHMEWHKIKGFRNLIAHDYFGIDVEEVWDIISNKIPHLKEFIQQKQNL
jgi:uncharacterized protein with HEPN domain